MQAIRSVKLPPTPDRSRLAQLAPTILTLRAGTLLHRVYRRGGAYRSAWNTLRHFGPTDARFDHHRPSPAGAPERQERAIGYYAGDIPTALAEMFQAGRFIDRHRDQPWLASFELVRDVRLLDLGARAVGRRGRVGRWGWAASGAVGDGCGALGGTFALRAGASMKLLSGPRSWSQNWSRAFYECYPDIEGVYYPSSLTNAPAMALYERVLSSVPFPDSPSLHRALADALLIDAMREAAAKIGYGLT